MSDDLGTFGSSTSTTVDTTSLDGAAVLHDANADFLLAAFSALAIAVDASEWDDEQAVAARDDRAAAEGVLRDAEVELRLLADDLRAASTTYGSLEQEFSVGSWILDGVAASYAYTLGMAAGPLLPLLMFGSLESTAGLGAPVESKDLTGPVEGIPGWLLVFLSTPQFTDGVGTAVGSADDLILGGLGIGIGAALLLGQQGLGVTGSWVGARAFMRGGQYFDMLFETTVAVTRLREQQTEAAVGFQERTDRIPDTVADGDAQVRIDRIEIPGEGPRFEVYIAGTVTFDPHPRDQAFDMTSNIGGVALLPSGAQRAIELAMEQAGVTSDSMVNFVGYSQGGLMAALLAASGDYNTQSVLTIGAPAGEVDIPADVSAVMVRHDEDPVTMLGGRPEDESQLYVRRQVFDEDNPAPDDLILPAHHYPNYQHTVALMDGTDNAAIRAAAERLDEFTAGATSVTSTFYSATRIDDPVAGGPITPVGQNGGR